MNIVNRLKNRLELCNLAVSDAYKAIDRAERIAKKDKSVVPPFQMEKLVAEVRYCKDQVISVEASLAGVSKYPPIGMNFSWQN